MLGRCGLFVVPRSWLLLAWRFGLVVGGWKTVYASASWELQSRRHEKDSVPALDSGVYVSGCLLDMTVI